MNSSAVAIVFFAVMLIGSVLYTVKGKGRSLFSFLVNLELEYVLVGVIMYIIASEFGVPTAGELSMVLSVLLVFMGLLVGSHYGLRLLAKVPVRVHAIVALIYTGGLVPGAAILALVGIPAPVAGAVILNGLMPYAPQLAMRLQQVPAGRAFSTSLIASLFPLFTIGGYAVLVAIVKFAPVAYAATLAPALLAAGFFASYGQTRQKKTLHLVTIIFVVVLAGIASFGGVSPLVLGFLVGLAIANGDWGATFGNITASFERFLYIFFSVVTGMVIAANVAGSLRLIGIGIVAAVGLWVVRGLASPVMVNRLLPGRDEVVSISSIGMLPAAMLVDAWITLSLDGIGTLFVVFFVMNVAGDTLTWMEVRRASRHP